MARPEVIRAVTAQRRAFFQSAGLQSLTMTVLEDSGLGERYRLAKVQARMHFEKPDGEQLDVADISTYVLVTRDDGPRIVFYLTHGDFIALMRARGIIAG